MGFRDGSRVGVRNWANLGRNGSIWAGPLLSCRLHESIELGLASMAHRSRTGATG